MNKEFVRLLANPTAENQIKLLQMYEVMTNALMAIANNQRLEQDQYAFSFEGGTANAALEQVQKLLKSRA